MIMESIRNEYVVRVEGVVRERSEESVNNKIPTGKIEILAENVEILNSCVPIPFQLKMN